AQYTSAFRDRCDPAAGLDGLAVRPPRALPPPRDRKGGVLCRNVISGVLRVIRKLICAVLPFWGLHPTYLLKRTALLEGRTRSGHCLWCRSGIVSTRCICEQGVSTFWSRIATRCFPQRKGRFPARAAPSCQPKGKPSRVWRDTTLP